MLNSEEEARASTQKPKGLYETTQVYPKHFEHFYVLGTQNIPLNGLIATVDQSYPQISTYKKVDLFSDDGKDSDGKQILQQLYLPVYGSGIIDDKWTEKVPFYSSDDYKLYIGDVKFPDAVKAGTRPSFKELL
jgi:hypothetical protein